MTADVLAYLSGNPVHDRVVSAFAEGVGCDAIPFAKYRPSAVAIVFGVRKDRVPVSWPRGEIIRQQALGNARSLILETGYLHRGNGPEHLYAAGWGGINGRADFRNVGSPGDRWLALGTPLKPWRQRGDHILVIGQVPWDASVQHHDHVGWCQRTVAQLQRATQRHVIFRPHPKAMNYNYGVRCEVASGPLEVDLENCHLVVTFNSNTAVEAVIAGVPAIAMDHGSMALAVTDRDLTFIEQPRLWERQQWANDLAYAQWSLDDMRRGLSWKHLTRAIGVGAAA